jgi:2-octaprenylphenol hydroxylase
MGDKFKTEVVVVGGGMVGASVALGLAQQDFKVILLEKNAPNLEWSVDSPYQMRVSALTRASENILKSLGAWQGIISKRLQPFVAMSVQDETAKHIVNFLAKDINEQNLGYVIENSVIQAALWEQIIKEKNITCILGETIETIYLNQKKLQNSTAKITFTNGNQIETQLVVGADGANSTVRNLVGIEVTTHDYGQATVVGCVRTEKPNQATCWQRYHTNQGPFAFLSMPENISSIAWYLPTDKQEWALSLNDKDFADEVHRASGGLLGDIVEVGSRGAFPLIRRHADNYVKSNLALVGDAAHTIHPQAGQGVNLGFLDAAALIETLVEAKKDAISTNKDWARFSVLRRYERWRRGDNAIVQRSMEGFDWLFKQDIAWKKTLRNLILPMADKFAPIKKLLMQNSLNGREAKPLLAKIAKTNL